MPAPARDAAPAVAEGAFQPPPALPPLQGATVVDPQPATVHELLEFHSRPYLQALAAYERLSERQRSQYGLEDDCAPFPGCARQRACLHVSLKEVRQAPAAA